MVSYPRDFSVICPHCDGKGCLVRQDRQGYLTYRDCPRCNGQGVIDSRDQD